MLAKNALWSYEEDIKQISSEKARRNLFLVIFAGFALKGDKLAQFFSSFNTCPSSLTSS